MVHSTPLERNTRLQCRALKYQSLQNFDFKTKHPVFARVWPFFHLSRLPSTLDRNESLSIRGGFRAGNFLKKTPGDGVQGVQPTAPKVSQILAKNFELNPPQKSPQNAIFGHFYAPSSIFFHPAAPEARFYFCSRGLQDGSHWLENGYYWLPGSPPGGIWFHNCCCLHMKHFRAQMRTKQTDAEQATPSLQY